jgi:hypothetical protein
VNVFFNSLGFKPQAIEHEFYKQIPKQNNLVFMKTHNIFGIKKADLTFLLVSRRGKKIAALPILVFLK